MPTTFIGYRRDDAAGYAGRLHEALERRLGRDTIFRDVDTLEPGQDFVEAIELRLRECRVFLALIGREWLEARDATGRRRLDQSNDYVRLELAAALARPDVRVIPVLIEGAGMPSPSDLPDDIRALSRRHAVSVRDDAWDHDVDRLAAVIAEFTGSSLVGAGGSSTAAGPAVTRNLRGIPVGMAAIVAIVLAAAVVWALRSRSADPGDAGRDSAADVAGRVDDPSGRSGSGPDTTGVARDVAGRYGVPVPPVAEVVHTKLIYTLLSASMTPLESGTRELRLRFRFSNEGPYDANAWDASFRLVTGGQTLAPTSGLNDVVPGHSLTQGIVTFTVPSGARGVVLRVIDGDRVGELPLDLSPTQRPAEDEQADAGDALSRAIIRPIIRDPRVLMRGEDVIATVERATSRRFANAIRLYFTVRLAAVGPYPRYSGSAILRLAAGDRLVAPLEPPGVVLEPATEVLADYAFEVPPTATSAVLRGTAMNGKGEIAMQLPQ